jgi:hypothetical protein
VQSNKSSSAPRIVILSSVIPTAQFTGPDGVANSGWSMSGHTPDGLAGLAQNLSLLNITYTFSNWVKQIAGAGGESADAGAGGVVMAPSAILTRLAATIATPASPIYAEFLTIGGTSVVNGIFVSAGLFR